MQKVTKTKDIIQTKHADDFLICMFCLKKEEGKVEKVKPREKIVIGFFISCQRTELPQDTNKEERQTDRHTRWSWGGIR